MKLAREEIEGDGVSATFNSYLEGVRRIYILDLTLPLTLHLAQPLDLPL